MVYFLFLKITSFFFANRDQSKVSRSILVTSGSWFSSVVRALSDHPCVVLTIIRRLKYVFNAAVRKLSISDLVTFYDLHRIACTEWHKIRHL